VRPTSFQCKARQSSKATAGPVPGLPIPESPPAAPRTVDLGDHPRGLKRPLGDTTCIKLRLLGAKLSKFLIPIGPGRSYSPEEEPRVKSTALSIFYPPCALMIQSAPQSAVPHAHLYAVLGTCCPTHHLRDGNHHHWHGPGRAMIALLHI
jgi:hypothetical protein